MKRLAIALSLLLLPTAASAAENDPEVAALKREISALKIDKALDLTPEQARQILPLLKEARARAEQFKADLEKKRPAIVAALKKARDEMKQQGEISASTLKEGAALRQRPTRGDDGKEIGKLLTQRQKDALASLELAPLDSEESDKNARRARARFNAFARSMTTISDEFIALVQARAAKAK